MTLNEKAARHRMADFGPAFTCRLTKDQHATLTRMVSQSGASYAETVRRCVATALNSEGRKADESAVHSSDRKSRSKNP